MATWHTCVLCYILLYHPILARCTSIYYAVQHISNEESFSNDPTALSVLPKIFSPKLIILDQISCVALANTPQMFRLYALANLGHIQVGLCWSKFLIRPHLAYNALSHLELSMYSPKTSRHPEQPLSWILVSSTCIPLGSNISLYPLNTTVSKNWPASLRLTRVAADAYSIWTIYIKWVKSETQ